jgi:cation/acetate symporter
MNGMATAADWMSAASFISMAGLITDMGYGNDLYAPEASLLNEARPD